MITLTNWWWPYSPASILSALQLGYNVWVIVSDSQLEGVDWFWECSEKYPSNVFFMKDHRERQKPGAHTLTRFDYLPMVMSHFPDETVLLTDSDVIHQRVIGFPKTIEIDLAAWSYNPRQQNHLMDYANYVKFPIWWALLADQIAPGGMFFFPTEKSRKFARYITIAADSLRDDGFGERWGVDQVACHIARQRIHDLSIYQLNSNGFTELSSNQDAAIWFAQPDDRSDMSSEWNKAMRKYLPI